MFRVILLENTWNTLEITKQIKQIINHKQKLEEETAAPQT